jgi:multimeric flavodoxin WrbA
MTSYRILGLNAGSAGGSAEIALKSALQAAEGKGAQVELVRLAELRLPPEAPADGGDDADWLWERYVQADGVIIATSIMNRTVAARLKIMADRVLGPNADAAVVEHLLSLRAQGHEPKVPFRVDERVLRPRVAGFLAVGGALTTQWRSLALPVMHTMTLSMQVAVVDQVVIGGAGTPRSVVLDQPALDRAARLGSNVASQLGRAFEEVTYLGDPGLCPMCHLDLMILHGAAVECGTCGARGTLGHAGTVAWTDLDVSVIALSEKRAHSREIQDTAARQDARRAEIDEKAAAFAAYDPVVRPTSGPAVRP